jgi:hypothetical protein
MAEQTPRIRLSAVAPAPLLVVRGDELSPDILRADATRFHRRYQAWGKYGVSAFGAADDAEVDVICETKLERFEGLRSCEHRTVSNPHHPGERRQP